MKKKLIAPCGMNCGICYGYLREKNKCLGCKKVDAYESGYGRKCIIRSCELLLKNKMQFCSEKCAQYPCKRLKDLDKRYRTKYKMSMIKNLEDIQDLGIKMFVKNEEKKWKCPNCKETLSAHRDICLKCGKKFR